MARELADVLHYLIPESDPAPTTGAPSDGLIAVPVGGCDLVRAAFLWNLAVEMARLGASPTLLAPDDEDAETLWPAPGPGPLGIEVRLAQATNLEGLSEKACSTVRDGDRPSGGPVLVRVPPRWISHAPEADPLLRWSLLFTTPERKDLLETFALAKKVRRACPDGRVGITVHGVHSVAEARGTFDSLTSAVERHLGGGLSSYGFLVDDLHVYRAIVSRRPIGLTYPQAPTARALRDVARILLQDVPEVPLCPNSR